MPDRFWSDMNAFAQFLTELAWSLTMGILVIAGILAAQAAGVALAVLGGAALVWRSWKAWSRRRRNRP